MFPFLDDYVVSPFSSDGSRKEGVLSRVLVRFCSLRKLSFVRYLVGLYFLYYSLKKKVNQVLFIKSLIIHCL